MGKPPTESAALGHEDVRALPDDAALAMVGVGVHAAFTLVCWISSTYLCADYLAELLRAMFGMPGWQSVGLAVGAGVAFFSFTFIRLTATRLPRLLGNWACGLITLAWSVAALTQVYRDKISLGLALAAVAWCFVANTAAVKLWDSVVAPGTTVHALYRFRNSAGRVIYIGITNNPERRFAQHAESKPWWDEVVTREICFYPSRITLAAAEVQAIQRERPLYNKQHNWSRR